MRKRVTKGARRGALKGGTKRVTKIAMQRATKRVKRVKGASAGTGALLEGQAGACNS